MGTWGTEFFDNDTAGDWADKFVKYGDISQLKRSIGLPLFDDVLTTYEVEESLAAIYTIACLQGYQFENSAYSEEVNQWVKASQWPVPARMHNVCVYTLAHILAYQDQIRETWFKEEKFCEWRDRVQKMYDFLVAKEIKVLPDTRIKLTKENPSLLIGK
jgi:hypothetical protein